MSQLVRRLPRRMALALGRGLGRVWADLDPRHVQIAAYNLRHAFPHWDEPRRWRTARGVYAHFGQVIFDILWMQDRPPEEILALIEVEGRDVLEAALREGRGVVLATAHIGNWELGGLALGWLFGPAGVVARPLDNPALDARLVAFRARSGNAVDLQAAGHRPGPAPAAGRQGRRPGGRPERAGRRGDLRGLLRSPRRRHHGGRGPGGAPWAPPW